MLPSTDILFYRSLVGSVCPDVAATFKSAGGIGTAYDPSPVPVIQALLLILILCFLAIVIEQQY